MENYFKKKFSEKKKQRVQERSLEQCVMRSDASIKTEAVILIKTLGHL